MSAAALVYNGLKGKWQGRTIRTGSPEWFCSKEDIGAFINAGFSSDAIYGVDRVSSSPYTGRRAKKREQFLIKHVGVAK
jgi:hypothetical protein